MINPLPLIFLPDPAFSRGADRPALAEAALRGGATAIQLRAKELGAGELIAAGRAMARLCRSHGRPFFVNDRVDLVSACGADGVHLGPDDLPATEARRILGPGAQIGLSVYRDEALAEAKSAAAAYVAVGAVYATSTKKIDVVGLAEVERIKSMTTLPVVAIGGIDTGNVAEVVAAGADGVAVVSSLSGAANVEGMAREFRRKIASALSARA